MVGIALSSCERRIDGDNLPEFPEPSDICPDESGVAFMVGLAREPTVSRGRPSLSYVSTNSSPG